MNLRTISWALCALVALSGCAAPTVPDFTYYRLPQAQTTPAAATPLRGAIVVDEFGADGMYADQALIYALDPGAQQLRQYHYQLWADPPPRILQRRLIEHLRDAHAAAQVTDELPASDPAIRVSGVILRFDRVPSGDGGFRVVVGLKLRADAHDGVLFVDEYYHAEKAAADGTMKATVDAFGAALDEIFAKFIADLEQRRSTTDAD